MPERFKVGDTVRLKSGGPIMTVTEVGGQEGGSLTLDSGSYRCTWFVRSEHKTGDFPKDALTAAESAGLVV